jgi:hypothetical protein
MIVDKLSSGNLACLYVFSNRLPKSSAIHRKEPMHRALVSILFSTAMLIAPRSFAAPEEFMKVSDITPGMKGYGLTVFEGTKIERFDLKVVGVLNSYFPKQDIIVIECKDPRLDHSGVVAGMSGSPIFIEGKLAGALSYTLVSFGIDPIAGVTPIQSMLDIGKLGTRGVDAVTKGTPASKSKVASADTSTDSPAVDWNLLGSPSMATPTSNMSAYNFQPLATPMSLSGFSKNAAKTLQDAFSGYGVDVVPMGGGSTSGSAANYYKDLDVKFEPGSAIGVSFMTGDMWMTGTGTVTYVDGTKVYAFGHPMMNMGETYFPTNTAWVHMFMASQMRSYKLSSPIKVQGSLIQDRQAAIYGDSSQVAPMLPLNIEVENVVTKESQAWKVQIIRHPSFSAVLVRSAIENALEAFNQDIAPSTYSMEVTLKLENKKPITITEQFFSNVGPANNRQNFDSADSLKAVRDLIGNPFEPIAAESVDVKIKIRFSEDYAIIKSAQLQSTEVKAGERVNLYVTVAHFNAPDEVRVVPFDVPKESEGQNLDIIVDSGSRARPELATPENLDGMIENATKRYPPRAFVITAQLPTKGVTFKGRVVPSLPESVLDSLSPGTSTEKARTFRTALRIVQDQPDLIFGRTSIRVSVAEADPK